MMSRIQAAWRASTGRTEPGRLEHGLVADVPDLAEVRGDAGVLERLGRGLELRLVGGRVPEVEPRLGDGLAAERALQERDVRLLVACDDVGELADSPLSLPMLTASA